MSLDLNAIYPAGWTYAVAQLETMGEELVAVATGAHHTVLVTTAGRVYTFGWDDRGQLGLRMNRPLPVPQCPPAPAAHSGTAEWRA